MTWQETMDYCGNLSLDGGGWWLPHISELRSLMRESSSSGCYWPEELGGTCDWYWSSSSHVDDENFAWIVSFDNGNVDFNNKNDSYGVRCVR